MNNITDAAKVNIVYNHQCLSRNCRYINAYFAFRLQRIRRLRWETSPVIPESIRPILSARENDYYLEYNDVLTEYCQSIGGFDIFSDLEVKQIFNYMSLIAVTILVIYEASEGVIHRDSCPKRLRRDHDGFGPCLLRCWHYSLFTQVNIMPFRVLVGIDLPV